MGDDGDGLSELSQQGCQPSVHETPAKGAEPPSVPHRRPADGAIRRLSQLARQLSVPISLTVAVAAMVYAHLAGRAVRGEFAVQLAEIRDETVARFNEIEWSSAYQTEYDGTTVLEPTVGTIQFLPQGYSLQFSLVDYLDDALLLEGLFGNPSNLYLQNITLRLTAFEPFYSMREEFMSTDPKVRWWAISRTTIGTGQSEAITLLPPGTTAFFRVRIPNVKQGGEKIELDAKLTGERYSYGN